MSQLSFFENGKDEGGEFAEENTVQDRTEIQYDCGFGQIWRCKSPGGRIHHLMIGDSTLESMVSVFVGNILFDICVTDPPYLATDIHFDNDGLNHELWIKNTIRILKNNAYLISFGTIDLLSQIQGFMPMRWSGTRIKSLPGMRTHAAKKPRQQSELYAVYAHPEHRISELVFNQVITEGHKPYHKLTRNTGYLRGGADQLDAANASAWTIDGYVIENSGTRLHTDVIYAPSKQNMKFAERTAHPTQKPILALQTLMKWTTNENALIYEPFAGSGTTILAADSLNRTCYAIEKNKEYGNIILNRLAKNGFTCNLHSVAV